MNPASTNTYCLFCVSGLENKVVSWLKAAGYIPISPQVVRWKASAGIVCKSLCRLLPGYVFFDAEEVSDWSGIQAHKDVLRVLQYEDGERALRGSDAEFVLWLKKYDGIIEISHAIQVGTKLAFVDGPLRDMSGRVTKVNKNRKQVQVALGDETCMLRTIWCSMDFIKENVDGLVQDAD